jgi:hypothetical protein
MQNASLDFDVAIGFGVRSVCVVIAAMGFSQRENASYVYD